MESYFYVEHFVHWTLFDLSSFWALFKELKTIGYEKRSFSMLKTHGLKIKLNGAFSIGDKEFTCKIWKKLLVSKKFPWWPKIDYAILGSYKA